MFGLIRNLRKEKPVTHYQVPLMQLSKGVSVMFAETLPKDLAQKTLRISEVQSYFFEEEAYAVCRIAEEAVDIALIVSQNEEGGPASLVIARRLDTRTQTNLFVTQPVEHWFSLPENAVLDLSMAVADPMWFSQHYTRCHHTVGEKAVGDVRTQDALELRRAAQAFEYVQFMSDDGHYALEAEKYDDGTLALFATLYRSAEDIVATLSPPAPVLVVNESSSPAPADVTKVASHAEEAVPPIFFDEAKEEAVVTDTVGAIPQVVPVSSPMADIEIATEASSATVKEASQTTQSLAHENVSILDASGAEGQQTIATQQSEKESRPQEVAASMIACSIPLAVRLLEEAERNKMTVGDVIRKVVDMPATKQDYVMIPVTFDSEEYALLAKRYGKEAGDIDGVHQEVINELQCFAGLKK